MNREESMCVCVCCVGACERASIRLCIGVDGVYSRARKRGPRAGVRREFEVRAGSRTARRGRRFASDVIVSVYTRQSSAD